jgi:hypothetical protein
MTEAPYCQPKQPECGCIQRDKGWSASEHEAIHRDCRAHLPSDLKAQWEVEDWMRSCQYIKEDAQCRGKHVNYSVGGPYGHGAPAPELGSGLPGFVMIAAIISFVIVMRKPWRV